MPGMEQQVDEFKAWLSDGENGSPHLRAVEWLHPVLPDMANVIVSVLEGPWRGRTVQVASRHIVHDFSRLPAPEPRAAADEAGQLTLWG